MREGLNRISTNVVYNKLKFRVFTNISMSKVQKFIFLVNHKWYSIPHMRYTILHLWYTAIVVSISDEIGSFFSKTISNGNFKILGIGIIVKIQKNHYCVYHICGILYNICGSKLPHTMQFKNLGDKLSSS